MNNLGVAIWWALVKTRREGTATFSNCSSKIDGCVMRDADGGALPARCFHLHLAHIRQIVSPNRIPKLYPRFPSHYERNPLFFFLQCWTQEKTQFKHTAGTQLKSELLIF